MEIITQNSIVDLDFDFRWESHEVTHCEMLHADGVNIWRDWLPESVISILIGKQPGDQIRFDFAPGEVVPAFRPESLFQLKRKHFGPHRAAYRDVTPRVGRFYPKGVIVDLPGVFSENIEPFRVTRISGDDLSVDFNHPLADAALVLNLTVGRVMEKHVERGGICRPWIEELLTGPGMQARWHDQPTDFFSDKSFVREDEANDAIFYATPRMLQHLDDTAISMVRQIYKEKLTEGMSVLDLMSSWQSHLPKDVSYRRVVGLGLNPVELSNNHQLSKFVVHNLNQDPSLPFSRHQFDAVVCTASVEYLTQPLAIFREVARVLKPGGVFAVIFSNRWFPSKSIDIWQRLHEFERLGLVLEYFFQSNAFKGLETRSVRGLPRPSHDKYFPKQLYSDPVYAVCGQAG
jgi:hypothetical protein